MSQKPVVCPSCGSQKNPPGSARCASCGAKIEDSGMSSRSSAPPLSHGTVVNDRYEIRQSLGKGGMGEVFLAYDRTTQQAVALKIVREESRMPGDDEALRQELILARSVGHPNVCRVHDLAPSAYGPILVMEYITGQTLHTHIRRKKGQGGYTADEFRRIAHDVASGVAAIHAQGLVHGDLKPGNVMVTNNVDGSFGKAIVLDFGFAKERARSSARRPGAPPDGGTPNYMGPERIRSGGASPEDDVYALGLTLLEMWTCRVPEPGYKPRAKTMRQQIMFDVPSGLSTDEIKQVFRCLAEDAQQRLPARHLRFFNPVTLTTNPIQVPRERLDPGPPTGRNASQSFVPGAQSLLVTFATNAPEFVSELVSLDKQVVSVGRRADNEIVVPEATVSGQHAQLKWQSATWIAEDLGSTNGTYVDFSYERRKSVTLMHGGEVQLGELRFKLVSFGVDSANHKRARTYLAKRDGLTGLLMRDQLLRALDEEASFADWVEAPLTVARYELRGPNRLVSDRPTILEMLALRRAATRVVELTDMLLLSLIAVTAGRIGTAGLRFCVAMVGPGQQEARNLVEQVVGQVQGMLPDGLELAATIARYEPGVGVRSLVDA
jgi:eukaryotic-like serine/threonine-protein kinase